MPKFFHRDAGTKDPAIGVERGARAFLKCGSIFYFHGDVVTFFQGYRRRLLFDGIDFHNNCLG